MKLFTVDGRRYIAALVVSSIIAIAGVLSLQTAASAATGKVIAKPCLTLRSGATSTTKSLACIPYNKVLTLKCHTVGQSVRGPYGSSRIWNKLSYSGKTGYVADAWLYTGSNNPVVGRCSSTSTSSSKESRAVSWANGQVGSWDQQWNFACEYFVERAYGTRGRYASAIANYNAQKSAGRIRTTGTPPKGALVFSKSSYDLGYGHVMISRGNGEYVSGGATGPYVKVYTTKNPGGGSFLGWSAPPSSWPGR